MKKIFVIVSAVLLGLAGCKHRGTGESAPAPADTLARAVSSQVAYVNMDTLMRHYDMYKELSAALEAKAKKADAELNARGRSLEKSLADAQTKVDKGLVTRAEAAQLQENLQRQQQNFMQHRDQVQGELAEQNQVMMNKLYFSIDEYLKEFNSDYRYGIILSSSGGTPVLNADPELDITSLVLKGLNQKYAKEKGKSKEAEKSAGTEP